MADDRQDLLNAINEFLDCSIVIPPSEVEGKDLLKSIATFQKLLLRKRKEREQKSMKEGAVQEAKGLSFGQKSLCLVPYKPQWALPSQNLAEG